MNATQDPKPFFLCQALFKSPLHVLTHLILTKPYEGRAVIPYFIGDKNQVRKRLSPPLSLIIVKAGI